MSEGCGLDPQMGMPALDRVLLEEVEVGIVFVDIVFIDCLGQTSNNKKVWRRLEDESLAREEAERAAADTLLWHN